MIMVAQATTLIALLSANLVRLIRIVMLLRFLAVVWDVRRLTLAENARLVRKIPVITERQLSAAARTEHYVLSFPIVLQKFKVGPAGPVM